MLTWIVEERHGQANVVRLILLVFHCETETEVLISLPINKMTRDVQIKLYQLVYRQLWNLQIINFDMTVNTNRTEKLLCTLLKQIRGTPNELNRSSVQLKQVDEKVDRL